MLFFGEQQFLQSSEWEKFQRASGRETFRAGESLFVGQNLPLVGKYAYSPRGPIMEMEKGGWKMGNKIEEIVTETKKRNFGWLRIEPNSEEELQKISDFVTHSSFFITHSPRDVQPCEILVMDILKSEEQLLAEMKPKTRYNIRLAEKKGVCVIVSKEKKYRDAFFALVQTTAERAGIRPHSKAHYETMLNTLGDAAQLYSAEYEGKILASNLMIFSGDGAIYLHGGSGNAHRNVMAPFLLQWRAIRDAKKKGCQRYDFGGVSTKLKGKKRKEKREKGEWGGITNFKQGFCPQTESIRFPGTYDIVLCPWRYRIYRFLNWVRRS